MRLDPSELQPPTDPIVNRIHPQHADDRAWMERQKRREAKAAEPPREVTGKELKAAEEKLAEAVRHRRATADALTVAAQADADAMENLLNARAEYWSTESAWRATNERNRVKKETKG